MKMCMDHWTRLRASIDARGLSSLIADNGEKAAANLVSELNEGRTLDNYDPLMAAHNALVGNCLETIGKGMGPGAVMHVMQAAEPPDSCPLCFLNRAANAQRGPDGRCMCGCGDPRVAPEDMYDEWLDRAADDQVEAWKALKP